MTVEHINVEAHTKATIDQIQQAMKERGWMAQADFFAEQHVNHGFPSTREQTAGVLRDILHTFPDISFEPIQIMVQGEWAMGFYWFSGTHLGMSQHPYVHYGVLTGIPPTGKFMRVHHVHLFRIQNGQITEHHGTRDDVAMVKQLGLELRVERK